MDCAVLEHREIHAEINVPAWGKVDEIPVDFARRLMSVVVETPQDTHRIPFFQSRASWPLILLTLLCYAVLTQGVKGWLLRRQWI